MKCSNHGSLTVQFYVSDDSPPFEQYMISNDEYRTVCFMHGDQKNFYLDKLTNNMKESKEILCFHFDPGVTPDNFEEKIKTFLVFL